MKKIMYATLALAPLMLAAPAGAEVKLGILSCDIDGGTGYVITSNKGVSCTFKPSRNAPSETYTGIISKLGIDLGITHQGTLQWAVLALAGGYAPGQLSGTYVGVNAEASIVTGGGANLLVGGFNRNFTLQPLSAQAQTGINVALAVTSMQLVAPLK